MFHIFVKLPPKTAEEDYDRTRWIRAFAMTIIGANLLLRYDELANIRVEMLEFFEVDLTQVDVYLPGGSKNKHDRIKYLLQEWPNVGDRRVSPLHALARWLRIRGTNPRLYFVKSVQTISCD